MSPIDYSKWGHIDISDDEDLQHPNIDKASLWKWEKEARYARYEEQEKKKNEVTEKKNCLQNKLKEHEASDPSNFSQLEALKTELEAYEKEEAKLLRKEKLYPNWNSSNMCKDVFNTTRLNSAAFKKNHEKTEEEIQAEQAEFFKRFRHEIKKFGKLTNMEDSRDYLLEHPHLVNEYTANFLVVWCVDLQIDEDESSVETVAKQTILMQHLLEVHKTSKHTVMDLIRNFFKRIKLAGSQYFVAFKDEYEALVSRIKQRAEEREKEAIEEYERKEKERRIAESPGGLDPCEVMESLPEPMRTAFESRDIPALQEAVKHMEEHEFKYHLDRCIKSGLWVPGPEDSKDQRPAETLASVNQEP